MSDIVLLCAAVSFFTLIFGFILYAAWRSYTPRGFVLYLAMWVCILMGVACAIHSTLPSSAPRRQVVGIIHWITDQKEGRSHTYTVGLTTDQGVNLTFKAAATPLFFAKGRDTVAVTYLEERPDRGYPRAIRFRALNGPRAGDETAVSADWFGPGLGVPLAIALGIAAIIGFNRNRRPSRAVQTNERH